MKEFNEDRANPQVNVQSLNKEFNIDIESGNILNQQIQKVQEMRTELAEIDEDAIDSDKIIMDNINRANRILDIVETNVENGDHSARFLEVAGQLINAVTAAATSITGISYNQQVIDTKNRALDIKEKEVAVKGIVKNADNVNITNNNLVMSREDLLKMIKEP